MTATATRTVPFVLGPNLKDRLALTSAASGNDLSSGKLGSSGLSLTVSSSAVTDDMATAAYYLQLYGQGTALGQLQQKGQNIHDPAIYQSYDYYSYYIDNLHSLGLNVTSASDNKVNEKSFSGSIKVGDILLDILSIYIPASELADMTKLFEMLASTSSTAVTDFLNFWWDNASYSTSESSLALGPLVMNDQQKPAFTLVYYNFNYSMTHWRSLFVEVQNSDLSVHSSAITVDYDMDLYNSTIYPSIFPIIQSSIKSHIASTPFSLG
jgi:hypothetical protein